MRSGDNIERSSPLWLAVPALALLFGVLLLAAGWGEGVDRSLRDSRDSLRERPASGQIVIVEIDARSLRALDRWPWPRRHHAALTERLAAAGASLVAFDVNFEVLSNPRDDAALAAALERAGGLVVLPTFRQDAEWASSAELETLPHEMFRQHVFLAGVNVLADADGLVRRLPLGAVTAGTARPSMASLLAEASGDVEQELEIDYAIDPVSIPRLSFIDVLEGRFEPSAVAGKRLIIGGTAADMEDRYAVPRHGVLPGVIVQTLAAETLLAGGVPTHGPGWWALLFAVAIAAGAAFASRTYWRVIIICVGFSAVLLAPLATEHLLALTFPIAPALAALLIAALGAAVLEIGARHYRQSLIDQETGLPNPKALLTDLRLIERGCVVVARIDRFEALAASLGPSATAILLQRVAERISGAGAFVVYRCDEHSLAWIESAGDIDLGESRLLEIAAAMRAPIDCGRRVDVTVGLGIGDTASTGKQHVANASLAADMALSERRPFLHFDDLQDEDAGWRLSLVGELEGAMAAGEIWNAYQPKLDLKTGRICGVETLVRWSHPERGPVLPDRFIPLIEASGRAADLTAHVFLNALVDVARWHTLGHDLSIAVNVSATLLEDRDFIARLREIIVASGVAPAAIIVEVTESAAVGDVDQAAAALAEWRTLGVAISIDDYGTGQSSLGYLQRLPASELKIDKSFIQKLGEDHRDAIMVRSTVALAHQLGMKVVAEGVEEHSILGLLEEFGCDVAQGWLIGRPMAATQLEAFLPDPGLRADQARQTHDGGLFESKCRQASVSI